MTNGTQTIVHFDCPKCNMHYTAMREQRAQQYSGDFHCRSCGAVVHEWTGFYDLFGWKPVTMKPVRPGEKI
jgi:predicted RNA-binding Zn-ribbon protein involved in translation (DUF1610 family)